MRKSKTISGATSSLRYIILTDAAEHLSDKILSFPHSWSRPQLILKFRKNPEDAALLHFTSGTTGTKGVLHVHHAVLPIT
jgi:acetyl-CoA synthetase